MDSYYNAVINSCRPISSADGATCQSTSLACQKTKSTGLSYKNMANTITTSTYNAGTQTLAVQYTGGDSCPTYNNNRRITINFVCSISSAPPTYVGESQCLYTFNWISPSGCGLSDPPADDEPGEGGSSGSLSGGDVFLIIFFIGGFLYVAIGVAYNYKFKGQTGVEMIPNLQFWKALPGLIKDGFTFTGQKFMGLFQK